MADTIAVCNYCTVSGNSGRSADAGADDLATALLTASRVLVAVSARSLAGIEERLTLTQFRVLVVLEGHRGRPLRALADQLGVSASTALRTVDRLVELGLVARRGNPEDRREVVLDLTEEGNRIVQEVTGQRRQEIARIVHGMPDTHQAWLVSALHSFAEAAGEPVADGERW